MPSFRLPLCLLAAVHGVTFLVLLHAFTRTQNADQQSVTRAVAITVDDLPGAIPGVDNAVGDLSSLQKINQAIPEILRAHHAPAIGFVNEWKLQVAGERDARVALLQAWLDAGSTLGNHTYSHAPFETTPLEEYEDDVIRGEVVTQDLLKAAGQEERYFRHPFLMTGPSPQAKMAFEVFLGKRGYHVAPVTVDAADWQFNDVLGDALERNDEQLANRTKAAYVAYTETAFGYFENLSSNLFHRQISQILLIHDSELNAECLDQVLTNLEHRGYRFISLDEAMTDPAYETRDLFIGAEGPSWLIRWKLAFGQKADWQSAPDPPKWIIETSNQLRRANQKQ